MIEATAQVLLGVLVALTLIGGAVLIAHFALWLEHRRKLWRKS